MTIKTAPSVNLPRHKSKFSEFLKQIEIQTMVWPGIIFLIIFSYIPMYGILMAFKRFNLGNPVILTAPWEGFKYFKEFFKDENFFRIMKNTLGMNVIGLIISFPLTITFALFLNELTNKFFKRITQTVSYLPHFISWVVYGGIVINILSTDAGVINDVMMKLNLIKEPIFFLGEPKYFWGVAISSGIIKELGWSAIIYLAAITGVDQEIHEAAVIDGAGRFQRMWYVTLPSISGTIVIMLILAISGMLNSGFDQIYMLQNPLNVSASEVIDTYVYKMGLSSMRFSYATAVGLFKSVIAVILLVSANFASKKIADRGLF